MGRPVSANTLHCPVATGLSVATTTHHSAVTFTLAGELDAHTAPRLARTVNRALLHGNDVLLDLSQIEFIDSAGLGAMRAGVRTARANGRRLTINADLPPPVRRLMELVGLLPPAAGLEHASLGRTLD